MTTSWLSTFENHQVFDSISEVRELLDGIDPESLESSDTESYARLQAQLNFLSERLSSLDPLLCTEPELVALDKQLVAAKSNIINAIGNKPQLGTALKTALNHVSNAMGHSSRLPLTVSVVGEADRIRYLNSVIAKHLDEFSDRATSLNERLSAIESSLDEVSEQSNNLISSQTAFFKDSHDEFASTFKKLVSDLNEEHNSAIEDAKSTLNNQKLT